MFTFIKRGAILILFAIFLVGCGKQDTSTVPSNQKEEYAITKDTEEKEEESTSSTDTKQSEKTEQKNEQKAEQKTEQKNEQKAEMIDAEKNGAYVLARPSKNGSLRVEGTNIVDEAGNKVQLRGISTHGLAWFPDYVNQDCFTQLSNEFGANLVRLAMYTSENGGYCSGDGNKSWLTKLVMDGVDYAKNADLYVIVDWHILHDNNPLTNKEEAKKFFDKVSKELASEKHVIYEICNEPNSGTSWEDIKTYANEVIPVIRANCKDAIIIVGTPTWSQEIDKPQRDPLTGYENILYTVHFYAATHKEDLRDRMVSAIKAGTPVFVSEFGLCDASGNGGNDLGQAQAWIDTMDEYGVSYASWSLCNKDETSALIQSGCGKKSGFEREDLSESGKWIVDMLQSPWKAEGKTVEKRTEEKTNDDSNTDHNTQNSNTKENEVANNGADISEDISASKIVTNDKLQVKAQMTNSWEAEGKTFYQYQLTVTNVDSADMDSWQVELDFSENIAFSDGWNGNYKAEGKSLIIHSKDYNGTLKAGESASDVGFIVSGVSGLKVVQ